MWILPLILIGAIAFAAASKSSREAVQPARKLQLPPPVPSGPTLALPGPISVLGEILRVGQVPPRTVILNAIAEAEALGRADFAADMRRVFGALLHPRHERGSCSPLLPRAPRAQADYQRWVLPPAPSVETELSVVPAPLAAVTVVPQEVSRQATEEEILAVLHTDPAAFLTMIASGRPPMIEVSPSPPLTPPLIEVPFSVVEAVDADARVQESQAPGSPLGGVPDGAWLVFVSRLSREAPTFDSSRHIGQYRQRRERLVELGIDPRSIQGLAHAQRVALDVDLADAHGHAAAGGLLDHLGRPIMVPGHEEPEEITLSGVLGVIQCAGLEGATGWLEKVSDRRRYPHTTQAFTRTNGLF
jgi:hypothetical protein